MNDDQIEKLLRNAPAPKAPAGLLEELKSDIHLQRPGAERTERLAAFGLRRWFPALSFATVLVGCVVAIGVQANTVSRLERENADLRAEVQKLKAPSANDAEIQRLRNENQELVRLRKDYADVQRLREEIAKMGGQTDEITGLRQANQQLATQIAAAGAAGKGGGDFLDDAKRKADRIKCCNNLKQIGLGARIWAGDNQDVYPMDFLSMSNELSTPMVLQCPSDKSRSQAMTNWMQLASVGTSYTMLAPGAKETEPQVVFAFCPIHHNYCLVDGSVQQLSAEGEKNHLKVVDGKTIFQ